MATGLPSIESREVSQSRGIIQPQAAAPSMWDNIAELSGKVVDEENKTALAAQAKALAERDTSIESQAIQFRELHDGNPKAFHKDWEKFSAEMISQTPSREHDDLVQKLQKEYNKNYSPLLTQFQKQNRIKASDSLGVREERLTAQIQTLSAEGRIGDEDYLAAFDELSANLRSQANLGLRSPEGAENAINRITQISKVEAILGQGRKAFEAGDFKSVAQIHDDLISGHVAADMPVEERRKLATKMMADLTRGQEFIETQERKATAGAREELRVAQQETGKELYSMIGKNALDPNWLEANRATLSKNDYRAGIKAINQNERAGSDAQSLSRISQTMTEDPEAAEEDAKTAFANGYLDFDDLQDVLDEADDRKKKPIDGIETSRTRIRDSLQVPEYLASYVTDASKVKSNAVKAFNAWTAANPDATDEDIDKRSQAIIQEYRVDAAKVLPAPYGMDKKNATPQTLGQAASRLEEDYKSGRMNDDEFMRQVDTLDAWQNYLRDSIDG